MALFDHVAKLARRMTPRGTFLRPAASLAVEVALQQGITNLNPTDMD
jgi:hypothetical protein